MRCGTFSLLLILMCSTLGCSTISFRMPENRFLVPENAGNSGEGFLAAGYGSKANIIVADLNQPTDEEVKNSQDVRKDDGIFLQGEISVVPMVDLFFNNGQLGAKVQVLGAPTRTAEEGNVSFAFAAGVDTGSISSQSTAGTTTRKSEGKYSGFELMALAGYRIKPNALIYGNIASNQFTAKGSLTTTSTTEETVTKLDIPTRKGQVLSILTGIQFDLNPGQSYLMLEGGFANTTFTGADDLSRPVLGGTVGMLW